MITKIDTRVVIICLVLFSLPFLCNSPIFLSANTSQSFHSNAERLLFQSMTDSLPEGSNGLFLGSGKCQQCHGYDTLGIASVDPLGNDINLVDDWRATMMANSAKDPFWRAKVSHESFVFPQHQAEIETKCTSCHAPLGHFAALHNGLDHFTMADLEGDSLALDGVSCLACHQQSIVNLGNTFSGEMNFDTAKVAWGPFISPLSSPMLNETGYEPKYSPHISDAGLCASCHTLITETIDYNGDFTGNTFVEQATYHEWLNSKYEVEQISCQDCHFEKLSKGGFFLVTGSETKLRDSFFLHEIAGANVNMLKLLKNNIDTLGLAATAEQFDEIIFATENMLRLKTLNMDMELLNRTNDTAYFEIKLTNKAGHKFPSGYPSRRAFIHFVVTNTIEGDTIFNSGDWNDNYELINEDDVEPHYNQIKSQDQVQIYEFVFADVNGNRTTLLNRGDSALKDNRLAPEGFTLAHSSYDTTRIVGNALIDANFNIEEGIEGSGTDRIAYHVPLNGNNAALQVSAKIYYQSMPPKWMEEMFDVSTPKIDFFKDLYDEADREPFLITQELMDLDIFVNTDEIDPPKDWIIVENISKNRLKIEANYNHKWRLFDLNGRIIREMENGKGSYEIDLAGLSGIYILTFETENSLVYSEKIHLKM